MSVFVDTSAFYALLDEDDDHHIEAVQVWRRLGERLTPLVTSNYVVVETTALLQARLGMLAVRCFADALLLPVEMFFVDNGTHARAVAAHRTAGRPRLSLVDCASFEVMRRLGQEEAFAFDDHFTQQGFRCCAA